MKARAGLIVLLITMGGVNSRAEVRWVASTVGGSEVARRIDSEKASWMMFTQTTSGTRLMWSEDGVSFGITDLDDINWARALPAKGDWIRVEWVNDQGVPTPNKSIEKYWRWSNIWAIRYTKTATAEFVEMWAEGQAMSKPTTIRVTLASEMKKVLESARLKR